MNITLLVTPTWAALDTAAPGQLRSAHERESMKSINPDQLTPGQEIAAVRGALAGDGAARDIVFEGGQVAPAAGTVSAERAATTATTDAPGAVLDGTGWVALPPFADLHAHLDKAYTWDAAGRPEGSLADAVACWQDFGASLSYERLKANARRQVLAALGAGVTAIRSHVNYHEGGDPLRGIRALIELREEFRGLVDLQVVAMHGHDRDEGLIRDGIALGVDLVGGVPHLTPDPRAELERTVRLAEWAGIGVDLHTDETLDPRSTDLLDLAQRTADWPAHMTRSAGHCVSLAMLEPSRLSHILRVTADAGVSIVTNPLTNLYLQGWQHPVAMPRAIPPLREILDAGVVLAAGGDNVQDPFNPLGNADMVHVAAELVLAGHLTPAQAWDVAASGGRRVFGLPPAEGRPGDAADLLLVRAGSVAEAVAERAPDRIVIRDGRVVAVRRTAVDMVHARTRVEEPA
jgi:cytosine deaminase